MKQTVREIKSQKLLACKNTAFPKESKTHILPPKKPHHIIGFKRQSTPKKAERKMTEFSTK